ncbi:MAG TPA: peptide chain release factor N(5)-glutamine methyltransferase [Steroidobacteraceae bacterium]|nr:peptide chain release factor N(5)-glutamine methyltransferase [Steroidobacteraceae bacterium]
MTPETTIAALIARGARLLASAGDPMRSSAILDSELLLAHALGGSRAGLLAHPERVVGAAEAARFGELLRRRAEGEPLAYLTGQREFWSLALAVNAAVLVPRPESELLVERALTLLARPTGAVADLGTGSGAIALALASERPRWRILATDVSAAALQTARQNATALGLGTVEFRLGDWFAALEGECFDLLISNPPYVAASDPALSALRHEPRLALSPGEDGFASLRVLARGAAQHLHPGGWLLLEHGATQGAQVREELVLAGFAHVRSHTDLAGHERTTEGQR